MIIAAGGTPEGEPFLFLGLTGENLTRLAAGEPIFIRSERMRELRLPSMAIALHYGRTPGGILAELREKGIMRADARITDETQKPPVP